MSIIATTEAWAAQSGLVRAVTQDGSVWFVPPAAVPYYEALPNVEVSWLTDEYRAQGASYARSQAHHYR